MIRRRQFIALVGGAATWPLAARAQPSALPVVGFVTGRTPEASVVRPVGAFRKGLNEAGTVEGQNVTVEYHWLEGQYDRLPSLMADLVRRRVTVIATPVGAALRLRPKLRPRRSRSSSASAKIPSRWVWSPALPGRAATQPVSIISCRSLCPNGWVSFISWCPKPFVSPCWSTRPTLRPPTPRCELCRKSPAPSGCRLKSSTLAPSARSSPPSPPSRARADALFVAPDGFFTSRRVQFATLAARYRIPASYSNRDYVEAGGLMSYGSDFIDMYRQVGVYTGQILKGAKPADLPVLQSTKFELVINVQTARALDLDVPNSLQLLARRGDRMKRREFITLLGGAAAAWPLAARAQQGERMRRIGVLLPASADDADFQARVGAFLQGLQQLGWSIGRNVRIDNRWATTNAADDSQTRSGIGRARARCHPGPWRLDRGAAATGDAHGADRVPGGWRSGRRRLRRKPGAAGRQRHRFHDFEYSMGGKWLELLKEIAPSVTRVAVLRDPAIPSGIGQFGAIQTVAPSFGVEVNPINARDASEIERAVAAFARSSNGGLIVTAERVGAASSRADHHTGGPTQAAGGLLRPLLRRRRRPDLLRT